MNQKTLTKNKISCECKCKFNGRKCNSSQRWNNNKCWCGYKKIHVCEKYYVWNPNKCICENGKYLASIMDDSTIVCDEVIKSYEEETKIIPTKFIEKFITCTTQIDIFIISIIYLSCY